jgi:hypothetical protein
MAAAASGELEVVSQLAYLLPVRNHFRDAVSALPVTARADIAVRRRGDADQ